MLDKKTLFQANKLAAKYYLKMLEKSSFAQTYLLERGADKIAKEFHLGFADKSNNLLKFLNKNNVTTETCVFLGLAGENHDSHYSVFRNRIMFPIINNGNVIGFGGRALDNSKMKYLNSKASVLYDKGKTLYLLDKAKKEIHKRNWVIIVEGYFDVTTLHNFGIKNAVAVCGTVFKDYHAKLLLRWTKNVFTCFDSDAAGEKAKERTKKIIKNNNMSFKNIVLPEGEDPDSYLRKFGRKNFVDLIKKS